MTKKKNLNIFLAIAASVCTALVFRNNAVMLMNVFQPIREAFLRLIHLLLSVVVFFSVVNGVTSVGSKKKTRSILGKALLIFGATTAIATLIGIFLTKMLSPLYRSINFTLSDTVFVPTTNESFLQMLLSIIPQNPFTPFIDGNIIQVFFLALLVAFGLQSDCDSQLSRAFVAIGNLVNKSLHVLSLVLPFGIYSILVPIMVTSPYEVLAMMLTIIGLYYICCVVCLLVLYCPLIKAKTSLSQKEFWSKAFKPAMTAFCSASSLITLAETQNAADELHISPNVSKLVLPLGATINMDGTAIFLGMICVIISSVYGIHLSALNYLQIILTVLIMSVGTPGVPGASLIIMTSVLQSVGLPVEGIALFSGIDMLMEMGGTALNVVGDLVCAAVMKEK